VPKNVDRIFRNTPYEGALIRCSTSSGNRPKKDFHHGSSWREHSSSLGPGRLATNLLPQTDL